MSYSHSTPEPSEDLTLTCGNWGFITPCSFRPKQARHHPDLRLSQQDGAHGSEGPTETGRRHLAYAVRNLHPSRETTSGRDRHSMPRCPHMYGIFG